jgi:hypothetical protein
VLGEGETYPFDDRVEVRKLKGQLEHASSGGEQEEGEEERIVEDAWTWRFHPAVRAGAHYGMGLLAAVMPWRYSLHAADGPYLGLNFGEVGIDWGDGGGEGGEGGGGKEGGGGGGEGGGGGGAVLTVRIHGLDESTGTTRVYRTASYALDRLGAAGYLGEVNAKTRAGGGETEWECAPLEGEPATAVDWMIGMVLLLGGTLGPILGLPYAVLSAAMAVCRRRRTPDAIATKKKAE